jgi:polysaccharide pyruvyl transferase WcaK-like protein
MQVNEVINLPWPDDHSKARSYFIKLIVKTIIWKITKKSLFAPKELEFVQLIKDQDRVHFTGGGNLTSLFAHWVYYSFFIIFIAWLYKKEIILTSQTIGPFSGIDRILVPLFLNMPRTILLREVSHSSSLLKYGILRPKVGGMVDSAYTLSKKSKYILPRKKTSLRIGVSIHSWMGYEQKIAKTTLDVLDRLSKSKKIEVVMIPHLIDKTHREGWDIDFMNKLSRKLPKGILITNLIYDKLIGTSSELASTIKFLTSEVDLLISSRYHGLVFALSENVPCIAFSTDKYYKLKNAKLLEQFYGERRKRYIVYLNGEQSSEEIFKLVEAVVADLRREKNYLVRKNTSLHKSKLAKHLKQVILSNRNKV